MVGVFINELVVNARAQGSPLSFKVRGLSDSILMVNIHQFCLACRESNAGPIVECAYQSRCSFSALHEIDSGPLLFYINAMYGKNSLMGPSISQQLCFRPE